MSSGPDTQVVPRHGVLTIRLSAARNLAPPFQLPAAIEEALRSPQGQSASSVTPLSVLEERSKKYYANGNRGTASSDRAPTRDSVQRKQCWWLPYVVLGFDNNEIMVDALGGNIAEPVWMYAAHL
jgi:serum/glucocorticoid-regulated kinase 2